MIFSFESCQLVDNIWIFSFFFFALKYDVSLFFCAQARNFCYIGFDWNNMSLFGLRYLISFLFRPKKFDFFFIWSEVTFFNWSLIRNNASEKRELLKSAWLYVILSLYTYFRLFRCIYKYIFSFSCTYRTNYT